MRAPCAPLRPFVTQLWIGDSHAAPGFEREHMVATGAVHIAVRIAGPPVCIVGEGALGHAVVGGPRSQFYIRDVSAPSRTIGAQLVPGAAFAVLGVAAHELAEQHVSLDAIWGRAAAELLVRLQAATSEEALDIFEAALTERVTGGRVDPTIAHAVRRLDAGASVACVVDEVGYSHRHFMAMFRERVGLAPKRYARVRRVLRAVEQARLGRSWSAIAAATGFSDQSHLAREFRELTGVTPEELRRAGSGLHVPRRSDSFKTS
ncbi:MAG: helix-turn-helix transcriptional regulator [Myxococcota bacterium]|nr:helix-turn-helix transcriptional regulator [Myxococcota bacterium]